MFYDEFPCRKLPTVMRCDSRVSEMPHLSVSSQTEMALGQLINPLVQPSSPCAILARTIYATLKGCVTIRPGFEKEYGRKQIVFSQNSDHLSKRREASRGSKNRRVWTAQICIYFFVHPLGTSKREKPARRMEKEGIQGYRPSGLFYDNTSLRPYRF
jgi:hypothetical protein